MNTEIWRPLFSPHESYSISNLGRVKNNKNDYVFLAKTRSDGYKRVTLVPYKQVLVHVLVASVFDVAGEGREIHHKNGCRGDNHVENLQRVTRQENCMMKTHNITKKRRILQFTLNGTFIRKWESIVSIDIAGSKKNIISVCRGRLRSACGFVWCYDDPDLPAEQWNTIIINGQIINVSSVGRVVRKSGLKSFGNKTSAGYRNIDLPNGLTIMVHRLVAMAFHQSPDIESKYINHINGDKSDNRAENLEWVTASKNNKHAYDKLSKSNRIRKTRVAMIGDGFEKIYESMEEACLDTGISKGNICSACRGTRQNAGGFRWRYA